MSTLVSQKAPEYFQDYLKILQLEQDHGKSVKDISSDLIRKRGDLRDKLSPEGHERFTQEILKIQNLENIKIKILEKVMPRSWKSTHDHQMNRGTITSSLTQYVAEPEWMKKDLTTMMDKVDEWALGIIPKKWHENYKNIVSLEDKQYKSFHLIVESVRAVSGVERYKRSFRTRANIARGIGYDDKVVERMKLDFIEAQKKERAYQLLLARKKLITDLFNKKGYNKRTAEKERLKVFLAPIYSLEIASKQKVKDWNENMERIRIAKEKEDSRLKVIDDLKIKRAEDSRLRKIKIDEQILEIQKLQLESLRTKKPSSVFKIVQEKTMESITEKQSEVLPDSKVPLAIGVSSALVIGGIGLLLMRGKRNG